MKNILSTLRLFWEFGGERRFGKKEGASGRNRRHWKEWLWELIFYS